MICSNVRHDHKGQEGAFFPTGDGRMEEITDLPFYAQALHSHSDSMQDRRRVRISQDNANDQKVSITISTREIFGRKNPRSRTSYSKHTNVKSEIRSVTPKKTHSKQRYNRYRRNQKKTKSAALKQRRSTPSRKSNSRHIQHPRKDSHQRGFYDTPFPQHFASEAKLKSFNKQISNQAQQGNIEEAYKIYHKLERLGLYPDVYTYSILINAHIKNNQLNEAIYLFYFMQNEKGITPDLAIYNSLITVYGKTEQIQKAFNIYDIIIEKEIMPDVVTFTSLITACGKIGDSKNALRIFGDMKVRGIPPDVRTYCGILNAYIKSKQINLAINTLTIMLEINMIPREYVFMNLISLCKKQGDVHNAVIVINFMAYTQIAPSEEIVESVLDMYLFYNMLEAAKQYFLQNCSQTLLTAPLDCRNRQTNTACVMIMCYLDTKDSSHPFEVFTKDSSMQNFIQYHLRQAYPYLSITNCESDPRKLIITST